MRKALAACLLLGACGAPAPEPNKDEAKVDVPVPSGPPVAQQVEAAPPSTQGAEPGPRWESAASGEGSALRLKAADGALLMNIACLGKPARLVVTMPSFSLVGSEDRFSLGLGSEPITLVADPTRQKGPGVTAEGPAPERALLEKAETVSAHYGTQQVGPVPAPPEKLREMLAKACK